MKTMSDEEVQKLTDDQLSDKLAVVFENGFANEQDPTYRGTPAHQELLDLHRRLVRESNRRLERSLQQDHYRLVHLEKRKKMPDYSHHTGKWSWSPWSGEPRYETLIEAIDADMERNPQT
jgi:hypothetical protein